MLNKSFTKFADFVRESLDWPVKVELARMGLGDGLRVLKVRVDWENLGQKRFDGTWQPYMKCWFYENWPDSSEDPDSWVEYPDRKLVDLYLNGDPGDVELVDYHIMKIARDNGADLIWETIDNTWRDAHTGQPVEALHRLL